MKESGIELQVKIPGSLTLRKEDDFWVLSEQCKTKLRQLIDTNELEADDGGLYTLVYGFSNYAFKLKLDDVLLTPTAKMVIAPENIPFLIKNFSSAEMNKTIRCGLQNCEHEANYFVDFNDGRLQIKHPIFKSHPKWKAQSDFVYRDKDASNQTYQ